MRIGGLKGGEKATETIEICRHHKKWRTPCTHGARFNVEVWFNMDVQVVPSKYIMIAFTYEKNEFTYGTLLL